MERKKGDRERGREAGKNHGGKSQTSDYIKLWPFIVPCFIIKILLETMMHTSRVPGRAVNPVWRDS